jgi:hypothetical protein
MYCDGAYQRPPKPQPVWSSRWMLICLEDRLWVVGLWHSTRHVDQTSSRRDADASKQVDEPGIGAKGVPERLYFEVSETIEPLLVSLF